MIEPRFEADLDALLHGLAGRIDLCAASGTSGAKETDFHGIAVERPHAKRIGMKRLSDTAAKVADLAAVCFSPSLVHQQGIDNNTSTPGSLAHGEDRHALHGFSAQAAIEHFGRSEEHTSELQSL